MRIDAVGRALHAPAPRLAVRGGDDTPRAATQRDGTGVAVGIGSAAIVAALLYASNVKKPPKKK